MKIISTRVVGKFTEEDWERHRRGLDIVAGIILEHLLSKVAAGQVNGKETDRSSLSNLANKPNEMEKSQ